MNVRSRFHPARRLILALCVFSFAHAALAGEKDREATLVLQGTTGKPLRLTISELKKLPRTELEAVDHRGQKARYSGVALRVLLDKVGVPRGQELRGEWLRAFVTVDATDEYRAVFGLAELDPGFTDRTILLADTRDGQPLAKGQGPFRVIVPGEKKQARWVRMVTEIRVVDSRSVKD